jgi:hypothetical protein
MKHRELELEHKAVREAALNKKQAASNQATNTK